MSIFSSSEIEFSVLSVGSRNFPNIVKFACKPCEKSCYGFDDEFAELIGEEEFHCKICGAHWSDLEPMYHMHTTIKKTNNISPPFDAQIIGPILDGVMGMTVHEYLNLVELEGANTLFHETLRFMKNSWFAGNLDRTGTKLASIRLRDNCALTFRQWITKQDGYNKPETFALLNKVFDEDDGFIGSDE